MTEKYYKFYRTTLQ